MKYDFKISTLSIVCVLCAAVSGAAFAAPAVRSLGGAGTYVGSTGATAAKSGTATTPATTSSVRAVRGGSMRVNPVTSGAAASSTRASATRASSTPRLSIGKYLSGNSTAVSGVTKPVDPELSAGRLQDRIEILEEYLGFTEGDKPLDLGVAQLEKDLTALLGREISVSYDGAGILTIKQGSEVILSDKVVTADVLQSAINDAIDGVVTSDMLDLVEQDVADIKSEVSALTDADKALQDAIDALEQVQTGAGETTTELGEQVADLRAAQESLQTVVEGLQNANFADETYVGTTVNNAVSGLQAVDQELRDMIADLQGGDSSSLADLSDAIEQLQSADTEFDTAIAGMIDDVNTLEDTLADVQESLKTFVTSDVTDALAERAAALETKLIGIDFTTFATVVQLEDAKDELSQSIADIQAALSKQHQDDIKALTDQHAADIKELNDALAALESEGVVTDETFADLLERVDAIETAYATDSEVSGVVAAARDALQDLIDANAIAIAKNATDIASVKTTADAALDLATSNATEIENLKPVAYSGLYSDLDGLPVLITEDDLTELQDAMIKRMNELHANGDYATAKEFAELVSEVGTLKTGSASQETVKQLQADVEALYKDYATKAELTKAEENLNSTIASLGTRVTANEEAIAKLQEAMAKKVDSETLATTVQNLVNENEITIPIADGSITTEKLAKGAVTPVKMSVDGFEPGQMAMFMNYNGVGEWVLVNVADAGDATK